MRMTLYAFASLISISSICHAMQTIYIYNLRDTNPFLAFDIGDTTTIVEVKNEIRRIMEITPKFEDSLHLMIPNPHHHAFSLSMELESDKLVKTFDTSNFMYLITDGSCINPLALKK